jgi:hypothetical protein
MVVVSSPLLFAPALTFIRSPNNTCLTMWRIPGRLIALLLMKSVTAFVRTEGTTSSATILILSWSKKNNHRQLSLVGNAYLDTLEQQTIQSVSAKQTKPLDYLPKQKVVTASGDTGTSFLASTGTATKRTLNLENDEGPEEKEEEAVVVATLNHGTADKNNDNNNPFASKFDAKKLMQQIKEAGTAGIISFALVQLAFWSLSLVLVVFTYVKVEGHLPDLSNPEELTKLSAGMLCVCVCVCVCVCFGGTSSTE